MSEHLPEKPPDGAQPTSSEAHPPPGATTQPAVPVLRREAVYVVADPRRFAGVAAVTALAGVAIGFALALLAQPMHHCPAQLRTIEGSVMQPEISAPTQDRMTWLGVQITTTEQPGATVVKVLRGTPADRSGLRHGDRVVSLDGDTIGSSQELVHAVRRRDPGQEVVVGFVRAGTTGSTTAVLSSISVSSSVAQNW
jgi:S1-C subfamily serine protease